MSSKNILKLMKEKQVEFVDLRFTDPKGKLQHLTIDATVVDEDMLDKGVFFDGSSIAGWKAINESDMILKPDLERPIIDPFNSHTTLNIFCDISCVYLSSLELELMSMECDTCTRLREHESMKAQFYNHNRKTH